MEIDWSKKPEGATHYRMEFRCRSTGGVQYYMLENGQWWYWGEILNKAWNRCSGRMDIVKEIPSQKQEPKPE
jgi:hypothetical protein